MVNVALPGLDEYDAAKLFLQRMHRLSHRGYTGRIEKKMEATDHLSLILNTLYYRKLSRGLKFLKSMFKG